MSIFAPLSGSWSLTKRWQSPAGGTEKPKTVPRNVTVAVGLPLGRTMNAPSPGASVSGDAGLFQLPETTVSRSKAELAKFHFLTTVLLGNQAAGNRSTILFPLPFSNCTRSSISGTNLMKRASRRSPANAGSLQTSEGSAARPPLRRFVNRSTIPQLRDATRVTCPALLKTTSGPASRRRGPRLRRADDARRRLAASCLGRAGPVQVHAGPSCCAASSGDPRETLARPSPRRH